MRIIIVGGGIVGYSLADQLLKDNHNIILIELNGEICQQLSEKLDLQIINGSGTSLAVLKQAGIEHTDMILAVTPDNEDNIVACSLAAQFKVTNCIARLRGSDFAGEENLASLKLMGITNVIHPERALVQRVLQFVDTPRALDSANFENGRILMRGYRIKENMELANKSPKEIREEIEADIILFSAIIRNGQGMIPDGNTVIKPGDILYSLFPRESLGTFLKLVGQEEEEHKIIMTGSSYSSLELAVALDKTKHKVTYVDPDMAHAEKAAAQLNNVEVLHGDCTQNELLKELNVDAASFFLAVSDEADYNMLSSLLAKAEGAREVIATTTETLHDRLFKSIGIDHVINPRLTTAREILETISKGHIAAKVKLSNVDIEAVRFNVDPNSSIMGQKVKDIAVKLKKGSIIGIIVREDKIILPEGETSIESGDHVIVITHKSNLPYLTKLFNPRGFFNRS